MQVESAVQLCLEDGRETLDVFYPLCFTETLLVSEDEVFEGVLEFSRWVCEFNQGFTEVRETVGNADGIVGDHCTESFVGLGFLIANANITKRQAPRPYNSWKTVSCLLGI